MSPPHPSGILTALVVALAVLVLIDASQRHRLGWFTAVLMLSLVEVLAVPVASMMPVPGVTIALLVVAVAMPLVVPLTALIYGFKHTNTAEGLA